MLEVTLRLHFLKNHQRAHTKSVRTPVLQTATTSKALQTNNILAKVQHRA